MKKLILGIALVSLAMSASAQKSNTTNAAMAYKESVTNKMGGDMEKAMESLKEAKEYIDKSAIHADTQNDPKTLMYLGKIYIDYVFVSAMVEGENSTIDAEEMTNTGFEAFEKSKKNDSKERYVEDIDGYCGLYRSMFANAGIQMFEEEKWVEAMGGLLGAAKFGEAIGVTDSAFYLFGGIAAYNIDSLDIAQDALEEAVKVGYDLPTSVSYLSLIYQAQNDSVSADSMFAALNTNHPKNKAVINENINYLLNTNRKEEAEVALQTAIDLDPNNPDLHYVAATVYQNTGKFEKSEAAFMKTLELAPDNVDAASGLGGLYFNKGADLNNDANQMDLSDPNYQITLDNSKKYFEKAVPYLELAHKNAPDDKIILQSLKAVYGKLQMVEKFKEAKAKLEAMD